MLVSKFSLPRRFSKALLVSAQRCTEVETQLANSGCKLTKVHDGKRALGTVRHKTFDAAILLSTGAQMDLVETILNLRDIRPSMSVILLVDPASPEPNAQAIIARAIPEVRIFTPDEFKTQLDLAKSERERSKNSTF